jgi:hypothetical protein
MTLSKAVQAEMRREAEQAIAGLRDDLPPGSVVYTVLTHLSHTGMMRSIKTLIVVDGKLIDASWAVARAVGWKFDRDHGGVKVTGTGMDMGFHVVNTLAYTLYPGGYVCPGECYCTSGDHVNGPLDQRTPYDVQATHHDGYALRHAWR